MALIQEYIPNPTINKTYNPAMPLASLEYSVNNSPISPIKGMSISGIDYKFGDKSFWGGAAGAIIGALYGGFPTILWGGLAGVLLGHLFEPRISTSSLYSKDAKYLTRGISIKAAELNLTDEQVVELTYAVELLTKYNVEKHDDNKGKESNAESSSEPETLDAKVSSENNNGSSGESSQEESGNSESSGEVAESSAESGSE